MALAADSGCEEWPTNALDAVRDTFDWMATGDHPITVDGRLFDHLPNRNIPVDELRRLLLSRGCPREVWDQVWTHVASRSRNEGSTWTIIAVGLALPMLTGLATRLTERFANDPSDIHAEIVRGFLDALAALDLAEGRIMIRLRWAAYRAGHRALLDAMDAPTPKPTGSGTSEPAPPLRNPEVVLARAVAAGVLTRTEADLIGTTRIDGIKLVDWPRPPELTYHALSKHRRKAEHRLAAWLTESGTGPDDGDPTGAAATTWQTSHEATNNTRWSRNVAKSTRGGLANQPPNPGLQSCG